MRVLFDQGTPAPLRNARPGHQIATAYELGWSAPSNGDPLAAAQGGGFDVLITTDQNLRYQQNLAGRKLAVLVLPTTRWPQINLHRGKVLAALNSIQHGTRQCGGIELVDVNIHRCSFFRRRCHSLNARRAAVLLLALAWSSLAFGGEIHDAAADGELEKVKALLKGNPDLVFSKDNVGGTPLHWAAWKGRKDVAELLLANKADINARDSNGCIPLFGAVKSGRRDMTELLLAKGADVNAKDVNGMTPLQCAAQAGWKDAAELLLASHADMSARDNNGLTPLHYAAKEGRKEVAELLLADKAEVNARDKYRATPLHWAAQDGHKDVAELLLAKGADANARDNKGNTPLHLAVVKGGVMVADFLRERGGRE